MLVFKIFKLKKEHQSFAEKLSSVELESKELTKQLSEIESLNHEEQNQNLPQNASFLERLGKLKEHLKQTVEKGENTKWTSQGLANFSDLLRQHVNNSEELHSQLISSLVKYLGVNQGGLFLSEDSNPTDLHLKLVSSFAYGRKKYQSKRIEIGEGLVGQCYLEKDIAYLTKIPQGYTTISSGLGDANPSAIVIVPLMTDTEVVGIIELASFREFKEHELDFLKKVGAIIGSSINHLKINEKTKILLEQSEKQAQELREAQEELKQNLEEISATQEELTRQFKETTLLKQEMEARQKVLDSTTILSESDKFGTITFVNDKLCTVSKYSREELISKPHNTFRHPDMPKELFRLMWTTIKKGEIFRGIVKNRAKDGTHYWVDATISPVLNEQKDILKYIGVRYVIESDVLAESLYKECVDRLGLGQKL
jgi:methyl-accepting chemotaxis protein